MFRVVMYSDLLTQALGKGEEGHRSDDLLLADLVGSRGAAWTGSMRVAVAMDFWISSRLVGEVSKKRLNGFFKHLIQ